MPAFRDYRRWAFESAAADLALRQAGRSLADVLGREPQPITFVVSLRLGEPPSAEPVTRRLAAYPGLRFKLDATPSWDDELLAALAATGAVASIDFKGAYKGTPVDVETDPELYRRCAEAFPEAWLEDPDLTLAAADEALRPHRNRITWDAPIHGVADIEALPFQPDTINVKPSRIGTLAQAARTRTSGAPSAASSPTAAGSPSWASGAARSSTSRRCSTRASRTTSRPPATTGATSRRPGCRRARCPRSSSRPGSAGARRLGGAMAKPRQVKMEQKGALAAMQKLESRSDEELEAETRYKSAAQAILGARAAERMDAKRSREHFRVAIAAARPQERLQLRRMAEASLALAERRAGDLKVAAEKLGQTPPTEPPAARAARDGHRRPAAERRHRAPDRRHPAADPRGRSSRSCSASASSS